MTTSTPMQENSLLLAEYALGVLDSDARARVAQQVQENAVMAAELALWYERLMPLAEDISPVAPAPELWQRIQVELGFSHRQTSFSARRPSALWDNVRFWRWLGVGASVGFATLALACVAVVSLLVTNGSNGPAGAGGSGGLRGWIASLLPSQLPAPAPTAQGYRFASLAQPSGTVSWTATLDAAQARMLVVPAAASQIAADRSAELWLVPEHGKPMPLGILTGQHAVIVLLTDTVMQAINGGATLAVSVEPVGGSRTGQPTGPIVAQGAIRGA